VHGTHLCHRVLVHLAGTGFRPAVVHIKSVDSWISASGGIAEEHGVDQPIAQSIIAVIKDILSTLNALAAIAVRSLLEVVI
jgi:hypothetical protein